MVVVLPDPFGPMNPYTSPLVQLEREPVHGEQLAVLLRQVAAFDHGYFARVVA